MTRSSGSTGPTGPEWLSVGEIPTDETLRDDRRGRGGAAIIPQSYLFVALEADRPLSGGARYALDGIEEVVISRGADRSASRSRADGVHRLLLKLPGRSLSAVHARLQRSPEGWCLEDARSTNGSFINGSRVERALLRPDDVAEVGHTFLLVRDFPRQVGRPATDLDSREMAALPAGLPTLLPHIADQLAELERIARSDVTVVLQGESGTGKELLARAIHLLSGRRGALVAVNCGALTETLAESQLFGHVRGAFTGAVADASGYVRAADGGTLLLDEVGDLGRTAQVALLRTLQEREVVPVGSARAQKVDVRFIAATPRPLDDLVRDGQFRADLYARLSGFTHVTPPLRNRLEDLGLLVAAVLTKIGVGTADNPIISPEVGLRLLRHSWPLNVRELEQSLLRAWALASGGTVEADHLRLDERPTEATPAGPVLSAEEQALRGRIIAELTAADGNVAEVARRLGKARMQLHRWMRRFAIDPRSFRR
jgi:DNA-binding NtrC family response regulator